jgi:hypothetical protein
MSNNLLEAKADIQKLVDFAGKDIADRFLALRNKIKGQEKDLYYWIKNKTPNDLETYLNSFENTKSSTQLKKDTADKGAKLVDETEHWKVYKILTFDAAVKYGKDTKWCITGARGEGDRYWKMYTRSNATFYFFISKIDYDPRGRDSKFALALYPADGLWYNADYSYEIYNQVDWQLSNLKAIPYIEEVNIPGIDFNKLAPREENDSAVCDHCGEAFRDDDLIGTVYCDFICEDCWEEYINSEDGLAEYFIKIANEEMLPSDFSIDNLTKIAMVWKEAKEAHELIGLADDAIEEYEADFYKVLTSYGISLNLSEELDDNSFAIEARLYETMWN